MFEIMPFDRRTYRMSCYNPLRELEGLPRLRKSLLNS